MKLARRWLVVFSLSGVLVACGGGDSPDGGDPDGGPGIDAGDIDAGDIDAGDIDAGDIDAGPGTDAGATDAGVAVCGDRSITAPEECDDGNTTAGDGCDASCMIEISATCGDGVVDRPGEECDDGNTTAGDGCSARCLIEAPPMCGDGALDLAAGEECDDGNTLPGDGCGPTCQIEAVGAFCGDGMMDPGEVCDDGNTAGGDGCSATCNFTGTTSLFVGMPGTQGRVDGDPSTAQLRGFGTLAADDTYLWFAEGGDSTVAPRVYAALRRIEVATGMVTTVAGLPGFGAEGIATNGVDTVWVATNLPAGSGLGPAGPAIVAVSTSAPFTVTYVTGSAPCGGAGCYADGPPGTATFGGIRGLTWFGGYLWIVDPPAATIRRLDPATNDVLDVAGDPFNRGWTDGVGTAARFQSPRYVVSDNSGVLYISDTNGATIRTLTVGTALVGTLAGNATAGHVDGLGGSMASPGPARIHRPRGITSDGSSVYWVEVNAHTVRQGVIATLDVSTLAGMADTSGGSTGGYTEGVGTAAQFSFPFSVAYHFPSRSLFVVDSGNRVIRRIQ